MDDGEFRRATKEHAAAVQTYMDAGDAVCVSMGKLAAMMANAQEESEFYTSTFHKADAAAKLVGQAFTAVRNALEP